jgi:hypothetical protein
MTAPLRQLLGLLRRHTPTAMPSDSRLRRVSGAVRSAAGSRSE